MGSPAFVSGDWFGLGEGERGKDTFLGFVVREGGD
jgi:hypothetical protein